MKPIILNKQREVDLTNTIPTTKYMLEHVLQKLNRPATLMLGGGSYYGWIHVFEGGSNYINTYQLDDNEQQATLKTNKYI